MIVYDETTTHKPSFSVASVRHFRQCLNRVQVITAFGFDKSLFINYFTCSYRTCPRWRRGVTGR